MPAAPLTEGAPPAAYVTWLARQPLAANTRRAYLAAVRRFCGYLHRHPPDYGDPFVDPHARDYAVRDFKFDYKTAGQAKPASVNLALAALDHFYGFLGLGRPQVSREDLLQQAPQALDPAAQKRLLRAIERCPSVRDRALLLLLFYTGLRIGEAAALTTDDVTVSARKGMVIVRAGKGNAYREVPLNSAVRPALAAWLLDRAARFPATTERALFLARQGRPLALRSLDACVRRLAADAGLKLSAHTLRHTCLTNLVRNGTDLVLVAEIAGHRRLDTTRRYSLPTAADRAAALEAIQHEY